MVAILFDIPLVQIRCFDRACSSFFLNMRRFCCSDGFLIKGSLLIVKVLPMPKIVLITDLPNPDGEAP